MKQKTEGSFKMTSFDINDLRDELSSNAKIFGNDTLLFTVVHNVNTSVTETNNDFNKIGKWAH